MRVTLIASTTLVPVSGTEGPPYLADRWLKGYFEDDADFLAEFAGRACYESWHRPNPKTASNDDYVKNIIRQQHFSVLEHASATFYVENVSRTLTHELVRHRHLSVSQRSQRSQRYVDEGNSGYVVPEPLQTISDERLGDDQTVRGAVEELHDRSTELYQNVVRILTDKGVPRKQAREAARSVLLGSTHTNLVVTGNHRAWREMLQKRWHVAADAEIRRLAGMLLLQLKGIAPNTYLDLDLQRPLGMLAPDA